MVCLGLKPGGGRMEGADESTELWRHLNNTILQQIFVKKCPCSIRSGFQTQDPTSLIFV